MRPHAPRARGPRGEWMEGHQMHFRLKSCVNVQYRATGQDVAQEMEGN